MWQHDLIIYILSRYAFKSNNISTVYKNGSMYDVYIYIYSVWWQFQATNTIMLDIKIRC